MAKAFKCNRCGKLFEYKDRQGVTSNTLHFRSLEGPAIAYLTVELRPLIRGGEYPDLCTDCYREGIQLAAKELLKTWEE